MDNKKNGDPGDAPRSATVSKKVYSYSIKKVAIKFIHYFLFFSTS